MKKMYSCSWFKIGLLQVFTFLLLFFDTAGQSVTSFTLINANNKKEISQLTDGQLINLSALPTVNLNIRANTDPGRVGSVKFTYDSDSNYHTESTFPYSFAGDVGGRYNFWTPEPGSHTITATAYSDSNATGERGTTLKVNFMVITDSTDNKGTAEISGELKKWHKITLTFDGPLLSETDSASPFLDYRLDVTFTSRAGKKYKVPGYFAADGNAGETGATSGTKWKVHFSPDTTGTWTYVASFKKGTGVAVSNDHGAAVLPVDGATDEFTISPTNKTGKDLRAKGRLRYVKAAYLQFAETGEYFRKAGSDAPENFLDYKDFDNTPNVEEKSKTWAPHLHDWTTDDPTWQNGKGKGIIGAVNYLSNQGMNAFSFLTLSILGDDKNVFPYLNTDDFTRIDVSKMDQWEIVMEHGQKMGMYLHFKLQEKENSNLLDNGDLGIQRKLYCRELIARFSHHLALNWNIGEENLQTEKQKKDMAKYLYDTDPYKHNIVIHTIPYAQEEVYRPLLGDSSAFTGVSIQTGAGNVYAETKKWVLASADAGKKWIVANDEQNPADVGVAADSEYLGNRGLIPDNSERIRKDVLWGNFMAGGAGVEYYFGYLTGETDLTCEDFRSREKSWRYARYALNFFKTYLPATELRPMNNVSRGWSLGKDSEVYIVYLKNGGSARITLPSGYYSVNWYNPRTGGNLQSGSIKNVESGTVSIGYPPSDSAADWTVLIQKTNSSNTPPAVVVTGPSNNATYTAPASIKIDAAATDNDGTITKVAFYHDDLKLFEDTTKPYSCTWTKAKPGSYSLFAVAFDNDGDSTISAAVNVTVVKKVPAADSIVFAVNAGGNTFTASNGVTYLADTNFIGGKTFRIADSIGNTSDDSLYQSERFGDFKYLIPVKNGQYEITFRFAEIYKSASEKRKFDVLAEDSAIISGLDIFSLAGVKNAHDIVKKVTVADGNLDIEFRSFVNFAKLSALHVKAINTDITAGSKAIRSLSTKEKPSHENIFVFPNPTTGLVNILSKQPYKTVIAIYDNKGITVYKNNYSAKVQQINLSKFPAGIYFIRLLQNGKSITRKVVLMK